MRKLLFALLGCALLIAAPHSGLAADFSCAYDALNIDVLVIAGASESLGYQTEVTLTVFYGGKSFDTIGPAPDEGILACVKTCKTDQNGAWSFSWKPSQSGYYDIRVAAGNDQVRTVSRFVAADRSGLRGTVLSSGLNELMTLAGDEMNLKALVSDDKLVDGVADKAAVGKVLYHIRERLPASEKNDVLSYGDMACLMQLLNEKKTVSSLESLVAALRKTAYFPKNLAVYDKSATQAIRGEMAARLSSAVYGGLDGFNDAFFDALVLSGVKKCGGWADVAPFLELLDNATYENNKSAASRAVAGKDYPSIAKLTAAFESAADSGKGGSGGGRGGVSPGISATAAQTDVALPAEQGEQKVFNDVAQSHWAFESVNYLKWKGLVSGNEKGDFLPDEAITRAEYLKLLCGAFSVASANADAFSDVTEDDWFYGYVGGAYKKGLIKGDQDNFSPNAAITRQDMATVAYAFCLNAGIAFEQAGQSFSDGSDIADYAKEAVSNLAQKEIIKGTGGGAFSPLSTATRAQAAAITQRLMSARGGQE